MEQEATVIGQILQCSGNIRNITDFPPTFIGVIGENGHPPWIEAIPKAHALSLPDSSLRIIPRCRMGDYWSHGFIAAPEPNLERIHYLVSFSAIIMAQAASLNILSLATQGRVSPKRLWRLVMHQGFSEGHDAYGLYHVNYYPGTRDPREQNPVPVPAFSPPRTSSHWNLWATRNRLRMPLSTRGDSGCGCGLIGDGYLLPVLRSRSSLPSFFHLAFLSDRKWEIPKRHQSILIPLQLRIHFASSKQSLSRS